MRRSQAGSMPGGQGSGAGLVASCLLPFPVPPSRGCQGCVAPAEYYTVRSTRVPITASGREGGEGGRCLQQRVEGGAGGYPHEPQQPLLFFLRRRSLASLWVERT